MRFYYPAAFMFNQAMFQCINKAYLSHEGCKMSDTGCFSIILVYDGTFLIIPTRLTPIFFIFKPTAKGRGSIALQPSHFVRHWFAMWLRPTCHVKATNWVKQVDLVQSWHTKKHTQLHPQISTHFLHFQTYCKETRLIALQPSHLISQCFGA